MTRKSIILATCLILAVTLATSVACISRADSNAPAKAATTVAGFPFVKIGSTYRFGSGSIDWDIVDKDLGNGWIAVREGKEGGGWIEGTIFLNLNVVPYIVEKK